MDKTYSQNGQDLFIKKLFKNKPNGYFLEIGGGDGLWISNTLLLEEQLGWTGILVEPTKAYQKLINNRPNCICVNKCVSDDFKTLTLFEIHDTGQASINPNEAAENTLLTQVADVKIEDKNKLDSRWGVTKDAYEVEAVPLKHILDDANAPKHIDYFSLDVEGHEETILMTFAFDQYSFGCLGIENPTPALHQRLMSSGYKKVKKLGGDTFYLNTSYFNIVN